MNLLRSWTRPWASLSFYSLVSVGFLTVVALTLMPAHAQKFYYQQYDWSANPQPDVISDSIKKLSTAVIVSRNYIEVAINEEKMFVQREITHKRLYIGDERGVEIYKTFRFGVNTKHKLEKLKVRVIKPNGESIVTSDKNIKDTQEEGVDYKIIATEGLEKGTFLEFLIIRETDVSTFGDIYVQTGTHQVTFDFQFITPERLFLRYKAFNYPIQFQDTLIDKYRFVKAIIRDLPSREEEKYNDYLRGCVRIAYSFDFNLYVTQSKILTWTDYTTDFYKRVNKIEKDNEKSIRTFVKQLKLENKSTKEKVFVLENHIKTNINQNAQAPSYQTVPEMLKSHSANLPDLVRLYYHSLKALNITAQLVMTADKSKKVFDPVFQTFADLDETLLYLPELNLYLEPASFSSRANVLSEDYQGQNALLIKPVEVQGHQVPITKVIQLPVSDFSQNVHDMQIHCDVNANLTSVNLKIDYSFTGNAAFPHRTIYPMLEKDEQTEYIKAFFRDFTNKSVDEKISEKNFTATYPEIEKPMVVSFEGTNNSVIEKAGKSIVLKVGELIGTQESFTEEKPRQGDIDLRFPNKSTRTIYIKLPAGYKPDGIEELRQRISYLNDSLLFEVIPTLENNVLKIQINEHYNVFWLPRSKYEEFKAVINAAADFNRKAIVIEPEK